MYRNQELLNESNQWVLKVGYLTVLQRGRDNELKVVLLASL